MTNRSPLPPEAIAEIEALKPRYPTTRAVLLPALHIAQRVNGGWLPEQALQQVADLLGLAAADVLGVVTFYDMYHRRPVGKYRIRVCTNLSCQLRGGEEVLGAILTELGVGENEVSADGRCSAVHFECLGSCDTAPMMMVNDDYHENLTPQSAAELVRGLR
jgi:NADH-quinone oxidoreductase E subunit